jgi:anti-sigma factor ChrR (cupin superfamily)
VNTRAFRLLSAAELDFAKVDFQPFREGIEKARLHHDEQSGEEVALLRYQAGASVPSHEHMGAEYILVLEGSQRDARGRYPAGTLVVNTEGSRHSVDSDEGCVVLAIWRKPVRFV